MRGHEGEHVTGMCLVREGPKDKNSKVHYKFSTSVSKNSVSKTSLYDFRNDFDIGGGLRPQRAKQF